jgi:hypothetical protein
MCTSSDSDRYRETRRVTGLTVTKGHVRGIRVRGSADNLVEGLRILGYRVAPEPIENGPPRSSCLGVLRTWGSPWIDAFEPFGVDKLLDERLAARLSEASGLPVLDYDYDFAGGALRHTLYDGGEPVETLHEDAPLSDAAFAHVDARYRAWRMRDWGVSFEDLAARSLPFSPQMIVEAWFLDLGFPLPDEATPQ